MPSPGARSARFKDCVVNFQALELTEDEVRKRDNLYQDATNCLFESERNSPSLKELRPNDQVKFSLELKDVATEVEQHRIVSLKQYIKLPSTAKLNPSLT